MADFVIGIIRNVLRHITVEHTQGGHVSRRWGVDSSELVVLLPQVALEDFSRGQEPENRHVSCCRVAAVFGSLLVEG
jgi:hypothetical protein